MKKGIHPQNYRLVAFKDMSNNDVFITKSTAPSKEKIKVLASSDSCSIQALSYLNHAFSVQFHPEVVDNTIQNWITIPKIKKDFHDAIGPNGIKEIIKYQKKNRRSLINGAKLIYQNWLNLIEKN